MTTKVTVTIPRDTGLAEDSAVNTFHFKTTTGGVFTSDQVDIVTEALRQFYDVIPPAPAVSKLSGYMSALNASPLRARFYQLPEPTGQPYAERDFAVAFRAVGSVDDTPEENAVCLSYRRTPVAGQNPRTRRGRIFIGPVATSAWFITNGRVVVENGLANTLTQGGKKLQQDVRAILPGMDWIVWSQKDLAEYVIQELYVDNEVDTQRRRGTKATSRVLVTV
jgi:hypothetical protein